MTDAARLLAAIARDQTKHCRNAVFQLAKTEKELDRSVRLWFWRGASAGRPI
jgi:hypothetical protein